MSDSKMSSTIFPSVHHVGGYITTEVLKSFPMERLNSVKNRFGNKNIDFLLHTISDGHKDMKIIDAAKYRYTFLHNLCLEMLQNGYHMAFRELFNLIRDNPTEIEEDDQEALIEFHKKLTFLKEKLIIAEHAKRKGRTDEVYDAQLALALYFDERKDFALCDHFYLSAFNTSHHVRGDGRRKEAEAHCNLGLVAERKGQPTEALQHYEEFYSICKDKKWVVEDGSLLVKKACYCLQRIYIILAELLPTEPEMKDEVLEHLHKAHSVAKEGGDIREIGHVVYLMGNNYDKFNDQQTAVKYHTEYLELCKSINDEAGVGKACQALAYANHRAGNFDLAIENLQKYLETAEKAGDEVSRREACADLGALYRSMGKYEQASYHYKRAFEIAENQHSLEVLEPSRCEYAVALAYGLLTGQVENIVANQKKNLETLLYWKCERVQGFSADDKTYSMYESITDRKQRLEVERVRRVSAIELLHNQKKILEAKPSTVTENSSD